MVLAIREVEAGKPSEDLGRVGAMRGSNEDDHRRCVRLSRAKAQSEVR